MKFSVLTPTLNRPDLARIAVDTVIQQTHGDWELIVYDQSDEPIQPLLRPDQRIRYHHGPRLGPAAAFQHCLNMATGDIVTPLSDDDRLPRHALETVQAAIGDAEWLVARTVIHDQDGQPLHLRGGTRQSLEQTMGGQYMLGGAVYWRRSLSDRVGGFDTAFDGAADFDLYARFARAAQPVLIKDVLYLYRDHAQTDSRVMADRQADAHQRVAARGAA